MIYGQCEDCSKWFPADQISGETCHCPRCDAWGGDAPWFPDGIEDQRDIPVQMIQLGPNKVPFCPVCDENELQDGWCPQCRVTYQRVAA